MYPGQWGEARLRGLSPASRASCAIPMVGVADQCILARWEALGDSEHTGLWLEEVSLIQCLLRFRVI